MRRLRVGCVGLGMQGAPIARRIIDAGYATTLYARRATTLDPFRTTGAAIAGTLRELGERCDLVAVCVMDDAQLEEVLLGDEAILAGMTSSNVGQSSRKVVVVHSTVHPNTVQRLAAHAVELDVELLDAPVSGGPEAAEHGTLTVMVGGDPATFERCVDVLATFGDPVRLLGPVGSGQLAKLLNNLLFTAQLALAYDTSTLASALDLDAGALSEVLLRGSARSYALEVWSNAGSLNALAALAGPRLEKDVGLMRDVAATAQPGSTLALDAAQQTIELFDDARRRAEAASTE